ncbi:MAG: transglycosylase SLT domain-containing protein [Streptococcus sp.]|nr:transglycosylase SLT domain-containing protein [Streptococcus sp.]
MTTQMIFYTEMISAAAIRHQLPQGLIGAICQVESGFNTHAIRYEPDFFTTYIVPCKIKEYPPCSYRTEQRARAMSWGLMQIMGQVARERGFSGAFLSELCLPEVGIEYGCRQLRYFADRYYAEQGWPGVIAAYNAGSPRKDATGYYVNQKYVNHVQAGWEKSQ